MASSTRSTSISKAESSYILNGLVCSLRPTSRSLHALRPYIISYPSRSSTSSSCDVMIQSPDFLLNSDSSGLPTTLGSAVLTTVYGSNNTKIVGGIKVGTVRLVDPASSSNAGATVSITVTDFSESPNSNPQQSQNNPKETSATIEAHLNTNLSSSMNTNPSFFLSPALTSLTSPTSQTPTKHFFAYDVHVDLQILTSSSGPLLDLASYTVLHALKSLQLPKLELRYKAGGDINVVLKKDVRGASIDAGLDKIQEICPIFMFRQIESAFQ